MEIPDRRIVVMRPGSLADGAVQGPGYSLSAHGPGVIAGGSLIAYVVRGEGAFRAANVAGPLRPGTLICAPAGPVDCEISEDHEVVVMTLREPHNRADDASAFTVPFVRQLSRADGAAWHTRLTGILERAQGDGVREEHVHALKRDLAPIVWLKRAPYAQDTLQNVFGLLWKRQAEPLSLDVLAADVGYTPNYLNDLVRAHTGRPLGKWIADIRMARARNDLENTNLPVADVGAACGYDDAAYFSRAFRRLHGVPPAVWRLAKQRDGRGGSHLTVSVEELKREKACPALRSH
jgi:AraC-like DNA-binding protein